MGLREYRAKREFGVTAEPWGLALAGEGGRGESGRFVVQKHAASSLHYDLRLEMGGVLRSWAVPKGPSDDPKEKRLAVMVEDHPVEYAGFEGTIPAGQYGGGTVMPWDRGRYEVVGDGGAEEGVRAGRVRVRLEGERLRGEWSLVRMGSGNKNWLLRAAGGNSPVRAEGAAQEDDTSIESGRTMGEIGGGKGGNGKVVKKKRAVKRAAPRRARVKPGARDDDDAPIKVLGVELTHPGRVLFPEQGLTKRDLAEYYERAAEWIMPHIKGRPITVVRCPRGAGEKNGQCFYQKHPDGGEDGGGKGLKSVEIVESKGPGRYAVPTGPAGLVSLVQRSALELHTWGSTARDLEHPDRIVLDLDPGEGVAWKDLRAAAVRVREELIKLGLESFVKTTGGKGLHVVASLRGKPDWDGVHGFTERLAKGLSHDEPDRYLASMTKVQRAGKIFIDYLRNTRGATVVAPYSTRARSGARVSTPLTWEELGRARAMPVFGTRETLARLKGLRRDPWSGYASARQSLSRAG